MSIRALLSVAFILALAACSTSTSSPDGLDPETAPRVVVDRFSDAAGHLMRRSASPSLPGAGDAIDFDEGPFITQGLGPDGQVVRYYNFDVQRTAAAPIYAFFDAEDHPIAGQLNVVGVVPGDGGYNDLWNVQKVTVPDDYVANTITSVDALFASGYAINATNILVNCPIVPYGSTASLRFSGNDTDLHEGWYDDQIIYYFNFVEHALVTSGGALTVPTSPIYVTFNVNPDEANMASGPASGFVVEEGTMQTHNVIATMPDDASYSPLWMVDVYDNAAFDAVADLETAIDASLLAAGVALVNCPVVAAE